MICAQIRNKISKQIGALMGQGKKEEAEAAEETGYRCSLSAWLSWRNRSGSLDEKIRRDYADHSRTSSIPAFPSEKTTARTWRLSASASRWCRISRSRIIRRLWRSLTASIWTAARKVAGNGFYYLMGDIARLHSAVISYARDFMIDRGFTYCVPPFMIRSNVVTGVMSFAEMDAMMYKIEGEDLYLIGTSEHSMIGKFIDTIIPEEELSEDADQLFSLLPEGKGRSRHRRARRLPDPSV